MKKKSAKRYVPQGYVPLATKNAKFLYEKCKMMWTIVCKRKIQFKRLIHQKDHEKAKDKCLFGIVSMEKPFNRDIVQEFYANLKSNISDVFVP